uniref:hypothetical protein n=7 Tax=Bacteria TaxID=2 RepID=UPI004047FD5A
MPSSSQFVRKVSKYNRRAGDLKRVAFGKGGFNAFVPKAQKNMKSFMSLAKSVQDIKSRLNVEKNYVDLASIGASVGQVNANAEGAFYQDILPNISQGDGQGNRHGNSLKLTGMSFPLQLYGQGNCQGPRKVRMTLLKITSADNGVSAQEAFEHYWDLNPLTGVRDFNAPKNYRSGTHDGITAVRSKTFFIRPPSVLSGTVDAEVGIVSTKFNIKLNQVLRYHANADVQPKGLRYVIVIQVDSGNLHPSTASTLAIPVQVANSAIIARAGLRVWFVDN